MRPWEAVVPAADREIYARSGLGSRRPFGKRPALLVVDVVESWTGSGPKDVVEAIDEYKTACGRSAWEALPRIRQLLDGAREAGLPIVFTKADPDEKAYVGDATKRLKSSDEARAIRSAPFPQMIAPRPGEYVLEKAKASAFFGTSLPTYLIQRGVDSLIVAGTATSGCVRATVLDGHSYGYAVFVVEECVFDRSEFLHAVNLFELDAKYADVIRLDEALACLGQAGDG
jgi:nicotinamidase-related amidase